mmetsp:Transcript_22899/g.54050  ORF Transcript_22899/g.54050 Transcript_22899/m.54050 type:complete len:641 (+) Transcript_22899:279-2201(+)
MGISIRDLSISSALLLLLAEGFAPGLPRKNSLTIRSMVSTSPPPSSSAFVDDDDDEDLDLEIEDYDAYDEGGTIETPTSTMPKISSQPIRRYKALKKEPLVAILGRPNVGKSAFVNRICGTQSGGAIVADEEGITRDRTYRNANFLGENFQVVDTGGLVFDDNERTLFAKEIREQAMVAIDESSGVILVVDGQVGMTGMDLQIAEFLRKEVLSRNLPVILAVNKCESEKVGALNAAEFWNLGLGEPIPVSALHGVGTAEVLEHLFEEIKEKQSAALPEFGTKVARLKEAKLRKNSKKQLPGEDEIDFKMRKYGIGDIAQKIESDYEAALAALDEMERPEEINVAIVGRPNVGKSSLLNSIFGDQRAIVSDMAGTTRDSIDAIMERPPDVEGDLPTIYRFVDTAGIRRKGKVEFGPEFFMVNRALRAIRRADVALLVMDATAGVTEQDRILAQKIADDGRACAIICNKWDAVVDKDSSTYDKSVKYIRAEMPQIRWAPILFISAETGQRVGKIYSVVDEAIGAHRKRVSTSILNEVLRDAILWQPPPARRNGAQAKIYYCNQVSTRPPTIVVFCNDPKLVNDNYRRYLDRKFRESLDGFEATPIRWIFRGRRQRDIMRARDMNGDPGSGGAGVSFPFPHAG